VHPEAIEIIINISFTKDSALNFTRLELIIIIVIIINNRMVMNIIENYYTINFNLKIKIMVSVIKHYFMDQ